ncbi:hypothetical protein M2454_000963 [Aequitasia blattaphilus]|uniref:Uncharacterized protein n=1 Tax=Aequitasia blattaphilus TaxID=2949332 RepID=A0ABT1E9Z1_9FIRM|nr:hypothetical protein [Aequitasia blattaphilus]MCP1102429.1 hypothetical protein [Aequitasia blattaphilus]MCR8615069.1 hypothetical protein [Aequitasia blattaphilus]
MARKTRLKEKQGMMRKMIGVLAAAMIIGILAYGILLNRGQVEWACGALVIPMTAFSVYVAIRTTLFGGPPLLVAVIGVLAVVVPTWVFQEALKKTERAIEPQEAKTEEDNREILCHQAKEYGEVVLQTTGSEEIKEVKEEEKQDHREPEEDSVVLETRRLVERVRRQRMELLREEEKERALYQSMLEKGDYLYQKGSYRLACQLYEECKRYAGSEEELEQVQQRLKDKR